MPQIHSFTNRHFTVESYTTEIYELENFEFAEYLVRALNGVVNGKIVVATAISTYVNEAFDNCQVNIFVDGVQVKFMNVSFNEFSHNQLWRCAATYA